MTPGAEAAARYGLGSSELAARNWGAELAAELVGDDHTWEKMGAFPWSEYRRLANDGVLGLTHPARFGGRDGSRLEAVLLVEQLSGRSFVLAEAVHLALNGPAHMIARAAAEPLAQEWLPSVLAGRSMVAIAITEVDAGTALGDLTTTFYREGDGSVRVDGHKCFVTAGALADALLVVGRFGGTGSRGIGAVLVPTITPGVHVGQVYDKLGGNAMPEAAVAFNGCKVPASAVLVDGDEASSSSLKRVLHMYDAMRLGIAAICVGVAQSSVDRAVEHLRSRRQGGQRLADMQGLRWTWARLALQVEQARLLTYRAARMADNEGFPPGPETAMAKLAASEVAVAASQAAIQAFGWRGIVRGPDHPVERVARETRGWTIAGGTTESTLNALARELFER